VSVWAVAAVAAKTASALIPMKVLRIETLLEPRSCRLARMMYHIKGDVRSCGKLDGWLLP
jgi:hypothetical protein